MSSPSPDTRSATVPRFAVVGRVNKGKSSILATLVEEADNERIRISSIPGETTRCQSIPLVLDGETLIEFLDTPGFNRARQALDWMTKRAAKQPDAPKLEAVKAFVEAHRGKNKYEDECLLLEPIINGAGILYVVDASKPFRPDFKAEMEILRWTGRPRMAIVNAISAETDFSADWRQHLGEYFNLTREFNAHHARFDERIRLLTSLLEIEETRYPNIEKTIRILGRVWETRRGKSADVILDLLEKCLTYRASKSIPKEEAERDYRKEEINLELIETYSQRIKEIEAAYHKQLVSLYKHASYETVEDQSLDDIASDLFSEETWEAFGLNKRQLTVAGVVAGAASGAAVDVASGGHTAGLGTLLGGLAGAAGAILKGKDLAELKMNVPGPGPVGADVSAGGIAIQAGPPKNPNFPWVLLDRAFFHYEQIISRAHGRRDEFVVDFAKTREDGQRLGHSSRLRLDDRRALQKWFQAVSSGRGTPETGRAFNIIRSVLDEIEKSVGNA